MLGGQPFATPVMVPLPEFRLDSEVPAFQTIGLDCCGPVYSECITCRCYQVKPNNCLFTCSIARGNHLELVPDLTTEAFVCALGRFIGRRGIPSLLVSDISESISFSFIVIQARTSTNLLEFRIQWRFILQKAPGMEQLYESNDGVVGGAELKVISRTGRSTTLRRPISKLYPLENTDTAAVREHSNVLEPII